jgi:hypothetical protein
MGRRRPGTPRAPSAARRGKIPAVPAYHPGVTDASTIQRRRAWRVHAALCAAALAGAGAWWAATAAGDRGLFHIGGAIGFFIFIAACLYTAMATGLVAAWGRRPSTVLLLHGVGLLFALAMTGAQCLRLPGR